MRAVSEADFEEGRAKALEARFACGYDPNKPEAGDNEEAAEVDQIDQNAWYEEENPAGDVMAKR